MTASFRLPVLVLALLGGCALQDSRIAHRAQHRLVGLSELELEACLGVPDQHSSFPGTDVLTYAATSSSSTSYSVPIVGGLGLSNGGYCHATFRVDGGIVTNVLYSGEKNATLAPDAYCAPIVRTCLAYLAAHPPAVVSSGATAVTRVTSDAPGGVVAPGGASAAPQPGASTAGFAGPVPTPK
ncbi:MAG: hypothetical protein ACRYGC_12430 [Janthinobacterium lividum]